MSQHRPNDSDASTHLQSAEFQRKSIPPPTNSTVQLQKSSFKLDAQPSTRTSPRKTPQEVTLAELKAQKNTLLASLAALPAIQVLIEEGAVSEAEHDNELSDSAADDPSENDIMTAANTIVKSHIKLLHEYNELKDIGQGLMGLIADQRGVRIVEVQDAFGIDPKD